MMAARAFGALTATPQPFEEAFLDAPVWRITMDGTPLPGDVDALVAAARQGGVGLAVCRVPDGSPAIALFSDAGFRLVETLVTFEGRIGDTVGMPAGVRVATDADVAACRNVARESFRHDRFHIDPAIEDTAADDIKAEWIANAIRHRADVVLVAEYEGAVCGFNAMFLKDRTVLIDLIAVRPAAQGTGIGRALVAGAGAHYVGRARSLRVSTQADNLASQRIYRKAGLEVIARQATLHWTAGPVTAAMPRAAEV